MQSKHPAVYDFVTASSACLAATFRSSRSFTSAHRTLHSKWKGIGMGNTVKWNHACNYYRPTFFTSHTHTISWESDPLMQLIFLLSSHSSVAWSRKAKTTAAWSKHAKEKTSINSCASTGWQVFTGPYQPSADLFEHGLVESFQCSPVNV